MRRVLMAVLALAVAGCATNTQVAPTASVAGSYDLIAVDGQAVPHLLASGEEMVSGKLFLKADGTFEMTTRVRAQLTSLEPFSFQRQFAGAYTSTRIGVHLTGSSGKEAIGAFFGRTLRVQHDGVEYLYLK